MDSPDSGTRQELNSIRNNSYDIIQIPGTKDKIKIGWIKFGTERKVSDILNSGKTGIKYEERILHKAAAAIVLNGYWKIRLFWWVLWRWYFFVKEYDHAQLLTIIEAGKKKVLLMQYYMAMASLKQLDDCLKRTNRQEAELILQQQASGKKE